MQKPYLRHTFCRANSSNHVGTPLLAPSKQETDLPHQAASPTKTRLLLSVLLLSVFGLGLANAQIVADATSFHDQSTPSVNSSTSITTNSGAELILAFISTDSLGSPNTTVKSVAGGGLTWNLVVRSNVQSGTSEIWRAFAPAPLSATVTASLSQSVVSSLTLKSYQGIQTAGVNGAGAIGATASNSSPKGAPTASITPLSTGSLVVGVGNDFDSAVARTPSSGQSLIHQYLSSTGDTYWVQQFNAANTIRGTRVTLADSQPNWDRYNLAVCEIVPATAETPVMSLSSSSLNFGTVVDGTSKSASVTLTSSGTAPLVVSSASVSGTGFALGSATLPQTLNPGQTLTLPVSFSPTTAGALSGSLSIKSNASTATTSVAITGTGQAATTPQISFSSSSLAFGSLSTGNSKSLSLTITSSGTAPLIIKSDAISGAGFSVGPAALPKTLAQGQSLVLTVTFAPKAAGAVTGSLAIKSNATANSNAAVALTGTGQTASAQLSLSSSSLSFGSVTEGTSNSLSLTLTSSGAAPLTVSSDSISGSGFTISAGSPLPVTLSPQQKLVFLVEFKPTTTGAISGSLKIATNSTTSSMASVALTGTGVGVAHSVLLSWKAPTTTADPVAGYYIYRAVSGGTPVVLNYTINVPTSYTDTAAEGGTTYDYEVKSADAAGVQSIASNLFSVAIPTP